MIYDVGFQSRADADADRIYLYLRSRSDVGAGRWFQALLNRLERLKSDAAGCPRAKEADRLGEDVRETYFKTRAGNRYRLVFTIEGNNVRIHRIRGRGQRLLRGNDLELNDRS